LALVLSNGFAPVAGIVLATPNRVGDADHGCHGRTRAWLSHHPCARRTEHRDTDAG